ncbi:MAG: hypothetical protein ACRD15_01410, partial [Vicinamibacterales bacterium]
LCKSSRLMPFVSRVLVFCLICLSAIACGAVGFGCGSDDPRAQQTDRSRPNGQSAARPGASASVGEIPISVTSESSGIDVKLQLDVTRAVRRVLSTQGGSLTATGVDGSTFKLTIPEDALVGQEEIVLTPVTAMSGLPAGVTLAAGVQMAPEGLLLLEPATLTIEPKQAVPAEQELPFGWSRQGEGVHAQSVAPEPRVPTFQITHFSGVAVASATPEAGEPIIKGQPLPCTAGFFGAFSDLIRRARQAALNGTSTPDDTSKLARAFIDASHRYLKEAVKPVVKQAETDDLLLPCAASAVLSWERPAQLFLGGSFEEEFGAESAALHESLWKGLASSFDKSYARCMRNESPLFQLGRMVGAARQLELVTMGQLLPGDSVEKIQSCGRKFDYRVDVESEVENVYTEQGQGSDVASSKTRLVAKRIVARYDEKRSAQTGGPIFVSERMPAEATASIEPRHPCPDQVRVEPGSFISVTVQPILNARIGELRCEGGKARCDGTDANPGILMELAPHVIESTYAHTFTGGKCDPVGMWNEFMMHFTGRTSAGSDEAFQVRGEQGSVTVVRHGTSVRRMPVDVEPEILRLNPELKDYVDIQTQVIKQATDRTRVSIQVQRH